MSKDTALFIQEILTETGESTQSIVREHLILQGFAKHSRYQAECTMFEKKYGCTLDQFKQQLFIGEQENFVAEDELLDWEYASTALEWWNNIGRK